MAGYTILRVSDDAKDGSLMAGLRSKGHQLLVAATATQGMAYLFINRHIDAVIIDQRSQPSGLNTAHLLRTVRSDVPILLLSPEGLEPLPTCVDACLSGENPLDSLLMTLDLLLAKPEETLAPAFQDGQAALAMKARNPA